jgi:hypothetical protein
VTLDCTKLMDLASVGYYSTLQAESYPP